MTVHILSDYRAKKLDPDGLHFAAQYGYHKRQKENYEKAQIELKKVLVLLDKLKEDFK